MNDSSRLTLRIEIARTLSGIRAEQWDALTDGNPFVSWAWLEAMERAGCVDGTTGWVSHHLLAWEGVRLVGAIPAYLKFHSYGEFVYDWAWANLADRLGEPYYPKLIAASPFSPVTGPRVLVSPALLSEPMRYHAVFHALLEQARSAVDERRCTGLHVLFPDEAQHQLIEPSGARWLTRVAHQYHWHNRGYRDFEDFLEPFRSHRRKEIRRERRIVRDAGFTVEAVSGSDITEEMIDQVYAFYSDTTDRYMGGHRYLSRQFFGLVHERMPEAIVLFLARNRESEVVAGTFNMRSQDRLFGRYWGSTVEAPYLHFETCFYAMIDYACAHGYKVIEPGAGGDHKYARGFEPVRTWSTHYMASPRMHMVLAQHLAREREFVSREIDAMVEHSPLRIKETIQLPDGGNVEG